MFAGADGPLVHRPSLDVKFHGLDGFNDATFDKMPDVTRVQKEGAASAILRLVNDNKGLVFQFIEYKVIVS